MSNTAVYDVRMRTSIGIRLGRITVNINSGQITGFFDILNHHEPFSGTIDNNNNCSFRGNIITLMRTVQYHAIGKILPEGLTLSIKDGQNTLEITGTPVSKTKES